MLSVSSRLPIAAACLISFGAVASPVSFQFNGFCTQACQEIGLASNASVYATLSVDHLLLPNVLGEQTIVSNSNLLALQVDFGTLHFGLADVVSSGSTQFSLGVSGWYVNNGNFLLASNGASSVQLAPAPYGHELPYLDLGHYEGLARATGTFLQVPAEVPAPSSLPLSVLALAALVALERKSRHLSSP